LPKAPYFFHHFALGVGKQDIGEFEFLGKLVVRLNAVLADTDDHSIGLFELRAQLAEPASFLGSTRGTVLRIKKQDNSFTFEFTQRMFLAIIARQAECGRLPALKVFHCCYSFALPISFWKSLMRPH